MSDYVVHLKVLQVHLLIKAQSFSIIFLFPPESQSLLVYFFTPIFKDWGSYSRENLILFLRTG